VESGITRQKALAIIDKYVKSDSLRKHCLAVEAAMRGYARLYGQDEELWGIVGLLHDFDYEYDPENHPYGGMQILRQEGVPEEIVLACGSHGHTDIPRDSLLRKTLYAVDELTGFIVAVALVMPGRALTKVTPESVKRKMKDKSFARAVDRNVLIESAKDLGVDFDQHVVNVRNGLVEVAQALGLNI